MSVFSENLNQAKQIRVKWITSTSESSAHSQSLQSTWLQIHSIFVAIGVIIAIAVVETVSNYIRIEYSNFIRKSTLKFMRRGTVTARHHQRQQRDTNGVNANG